MPPLLGETLLSCVFADVLGSVPCVWLVSSLSAAALLSVLPERPQGTGLPAERRPFAAAGATGRLLSDRQEVSASSAPRAKAGARARLRGPHTTELSDPLFSNFKKLQ